MNRVEAADGMTGAPGPGPIWGPFARVPARVYGWEIARRNRRFDAGRGVLSIDRPVISVGNLSVGGTGKSPMVLRIVSMLRVAGRHPCIAMRGYAGGADGAGSDEAKVYRSELADVPIVARPDRLEGLLDLFRTAEGEAVNCVVLDDGFQHRRLARQLDIVLLDATRDAFRDRLLPAGWLREPVASLARAHVVVVTHAQAVAAANVEAMLGAARGVNPRVVTAVCEHAWQGLRTATAEGDAEVAVDVLGSRRVAVCCAIGNPGAFVSQVRQAAAGPMAGELILRDHDPLHVDTIARLLRMLHESGAEALVVTEKDWVKLMRVRPEAWPCPVYRPRLEVRFRSGEEALRAAVVEASAPQESGE